MFRQLSLLFLLTILLGQGKTDILKLPTRKDLHLQRDAHLTIEEVHERLRRASGNPTYTAQSLYDTNNYGLVHYSGNISDVIFVLTYRLSGGTVTTSNLYISTNYGKTFTKINSKVGSGATLANRIYVDPEDSKTVFFADATASKLYVSTDEGNSFITRNLSNNINPRSLLLHPTVGKWFLAHDPTNNGLYVSRDLGESFDKIDDNVHFETDYQWGVKPYDKDPTIVYYNTDSTQSTAQVDLYTQTHPYGSSSRKEFDPLLGSHDAFLMVDRYIFVQKTINSNRTLWVSVDRKPFNQAKIPRDNHLTYLVASIRSLQALVVIRHTDNIYNLYMSEEQGVLYYQALSDIQVDHPSGGGYFIDLELIESMNYTTHIANQYVRSSPADTNPSVRTLISFNAGADWEPLRPPTSADSECIQPLCSLHLHMSTSEYWRTGVYSQESAPGIIIAHGATGQSLNDDNTNLFISTDGGSTWSQTLDGTWGVSVLDHGGLIVAARDYHNGVVASRTLMYTCNEGSSWSQLTFTDENLRVYGVITEPGETTTVVSLYGYMSSGWIVVYVNFTNIFTSVCRADDYYSWTPFDENTNTGCLLGASVTIERRKPTHCCLNGETYNRELNYSVCACSEEDFECDYGYKHANGINGACIRDMDVTLNPVCVNESVSYTLSQGYYKIGGDVCMGGVESNYAPYEAPCCFDKTASGTYVPTKTVNITTTVSVVSTSTLSVVSTSTTSVVSTSTVSVVSTSTLSVVSTATVTSNVTVRMGAQTDSASTNTTKTVCVTNPPSTFTKTATQTKTTTVSIISTTTVTSNVTVRTGAQTNSASSNTLPIILGIMLAISLLVILAFVGVAMVICIVKMKKSLSNSGYNRVQISYHREDMSPLGGVHNISYVDDDDDDEKPLAM